MEVQAVANCISARELLVGSGGSVSGKHQLLVQWHSNWEREVPLAYKEQTAESSGSNKKTFKCHYEVAVRLNYACMRFVLFFGCYL